jgi:hypothetical protein
VKRGRKAVWIGGALLLVLVAALVVLAPREAKGFEPDWLMATQPQKRKQTYYTIDPGSSRPKFDIAIVQGSWDLHMKLPDFASKIRQDFKAKEGWTEAGTSQGNSFRWSRLDGTSGYTFEVMDLGDKIRVQSHSSRRLNWPEKAHRWIRKLFRSEA